MTNDIFKNPVIESDMQEITKALGKKVHRFEGKNMLITGASGMLAGYLVIFLLYANRKIFKKPVKLYLVGRKDEKVFGNDKNISYIAADISRPLHLAKNINFIVHAASKAAPKNYTKDKVDTLNSNILGLYNLLSLQSKNLESFLYFSSGEIYGNPKVNKPISEDYIGTVDHLNERSCYTEGKRAAETICMNYNWEKGLPVKIARIFHTFGPRLNLTDGRIFSDVIKNGLEKKDIEIKGDPAIKRPFLYLMDATVMFFLILLSDKNGEVYNVSNDKNITTIGSFAEVVGKEFSRYYEKKIHVLINKDNKNKYYKHAVKAIRPNIDKFKKDFNYSPKISVGEAAERTVKYYMGVK